MDVCNNSKCEDCMLRSISDGGCGLDFSPEFRINLDEKFRNEKRIDEFMKEFSMVWKEKCPDLRFGQMISNFVLHYGDIFYLEENKFLEEFESFSENSK